MSASPCFMDSFADSSSTSCNFSTTTLPPFMVMTTHSPILSATSSASPFSSTISFLTSAHGSLSSLSLRRPC